MYRRSIDYGALNQSTQVVDFSHFRRKNEEEVKFEFDPEDNGLQMWEAPNSLSHMIIISALLSQEQFQPVPPASCVFPANFSLKNVPRNYHNFQHPKTLEGLLQVVRTYTQPQLLTELLTNYPIIWFFLNCLARATILNYLTHHHDDWLCGNQHELLEDYDAELRGNMLEILASALNLQLSVEFYGTGKTQPYVTQTWGKNSAAVVVNAIVQSEECKWHICGPAGSNTKSSAVYGSKDVFRPKNSKEPENLDTTDEGLSVQRAFESRSANKDMNSKCNLCGCKLKQCDCVGHKIITPRPINNHNRSFFDGLGLGLGKITRSKASEQKKWVSGTKERCHEN